MKILALENEVPGVEQTAFRPHLKAEAKRAWELYKQGLVRELYFRKNEHRAVLVLECRDETEAREILATLPLVRERLIDFEILPLVPYPGFERLFSELKGGPHV